jgi:hypothetical protein
MPMMTAEDFAEILDEKEPHIKVLREAAKNMDYGDFEVLFTVRAGVITKMQLKWVGKTWLKEKR